jgi:hypothetical protein
MAAGWIKPVNSLVANIDPDEALTRGIPDRAFAGVVLAVEHDPNAVI